MARVLVTGSEGFIGKHLMAELPDAIPCDIGTKSLQGPFDGIIHLAAVSRVRDGEADRINCLETNILFTARLLEWQPKWLIFASTCEQPVNVYGYSKRAAEDYIRLRGIKYIILRLSNVYGAGMKDDKLLAKVRRGDAAPDSAFPFEYIHVSDVVAQIKQCMKDIERPGFTPYIMRLANGIANNKEELLHVAASY